MTGRLVTALNLTLGLAAGAVVAVALIGPAATQPAASASPTTAGAGDPASVPTTAPRHPSTTVTRTTRTVPATTPPPTVPPTTRPVVTLAPAPPPAAPPPTRRFPVFTVPATTAPVTTTTSTTIAPIGGRLPVPPSTLPLRTKAQSSHVSPVFAALSGGGFFAAFAIMTGRFLLTRGRKP